MDFIMNTSRALLLVLAACAVGAVVLRAQEAEPKVSIVRLDPRFDKLVPKDAVLERLAGGFTWSEGPVWDKQNGYLLFSDVPQNSIFKWQEGKGISLFLKPSGYTGSEPFTGREPGSNGLTFDSSHHLVINQHGNRRVVRQEADGTMTVLADHYEGKRLNSPNDLVYKSNGDLYFTDPPYGLPKTFDDPGKETPFQGVYKLTPGGKLTLLIKDIQAPNGIAFSPDEKILYVNDSVTVTWRAYDVQPDGALANGRVLFDAAKVKEGKPGTADGMKVDAEGNIFSAAPAGIFVLSPDGTLLGRFDLGVPTGNCAWGEDGSTLFITANHNLYRIRLSIKGAGW
jgi:gluconolactonase